MSKQDLSSARGSLQMFVGDDKVTEIVIVYKGSLPDVSTSLHFEEIFQCGDLKSTTCTNERRERKN